MHLRSTDRPGRLPEKKRRAEPGRWGGGEVGPGHAGLTGPCGDVF